MNDLDNKFKKLLLILSTIIGIFFLMTISALFLYMRGLLTNDIAPAPGGNVRQSQNQVQPPEVSLEPQGYELRMNATEYQIELFEELVRAHDQFEASGTDAALQTYASAIVRNFVADFFTLSNKESRADVGGVQFFSHDVVDNFTTAAVDEFYLYLGRQIAAFGHEAMPTIESTTVTHFAFDTRVIEVEEEADEAMDTWELIEPEVPVELEYERIIVVDVEWTFAQTPLPQIEAFQTSARFILMEVEGEGWRIFQIEMTEEACEYDAWGQCVIEPHDWVPPTTQ